MHFATLGKWFRKLYSASLTKLDCSTVQIKKVELKLGPICFDSVTDRSVQVRCVLLNWISTRHYYACLM